LHLNSPKMQHIIVQGVDPETTEHMLEVEGLHNVRRLLRGRTWFSGDVELGRKTETFNRLNLIGRVILPSQVDLSRFVNKYETNSVDSDRSLIAKAEQQGDERANRILAQCSVDGLYIDWNPRTKSIHESIVFLGSTKPGLVYFWNYHTNNLVRYQTDLCPIISVKLIPSSSGIVGGYVRDTKRSLFWKDVNRLDTFEELADEKPGRWIYPLAYSAMRMKSKSESLPELDKLLPFTLFCSSRKAIAFPDRHSNCITLDLFSREVKSIPIPVGFFVWSIFQDRVLGSLPGILEPLVYDISS
jgi:hypothetical protein